MSSTGGPSVIEEKLSIRLPAGGLELAGLGGVALLASMAYEGRKMREAEEKQQLNPT